MKSKAPNVVLTCSFDIPVAEKYYHMRAILPLKSSTKYYVTVRGITGAGNILESCSNGVVVDVTPPAIQISEVGLEKTFPSGQVVYQRETDSVTASWNSTDPENGINSTVVMLGSYPGMQVDL